MFNCYGKSDVTIQKDVLHELLSDPRVRTQVNIATSDGLVTLSGKVAHLSQKINANAAALRVNGVRAVADEIEVQVPEEERKTDEDLARIAITALEWTSEIPQGLKVSVENGWITLSGHTNWDYERMAAQKAVTQLSGVRGVTNAIEIKESAHTLDVQLEIESALARAVDAERRQIKVLVEGDKVILTGSVTTQSQITAAKTAAWNAPGIRTVDNRLTLTI